MDASNPEDEPLPQALKFHAAGILDQAEPLYRAAIAADPSQLTAHSNLGALLQSQQRIDEALACYRHVLDLQPDHAQALSNMGSIFKDRKEVDAAIDCYTRSLAANPRMPATHYNLGIVYQQRLELDLARHCYEMAVSLKPDYAQAYNNLGTIHRQQGRIQEALAAYDSAVRYRPDSVEGHRNRALLRLLLGDFAQGWPELEWRFQSTESPAITANRPLWRGEPLANRTLLLVSEQGLGDTIQFVRYAAQIKQRFPCQISILGAPGLVALLGRAKGVDHAVSREDQSPEFDAYIPLFNLPALFGTTVETVPAPIPYLSAEPARIDRWRESLGPRNSFRVGIAWQGNPQYSADSSRSIPLREFTVLSQVPQVELLSLQLGNGSEQLKVVGPGPGIRDLRADGLDVDAAFVDTAAVMTQLDLVITSDTSIAHLAGAMGIPVWVALAKVPDWRWMLEREDCPWYPTMRLFRQETAGDWRGVFERIARELAIHARV